MVTNGQPGIKILFNIIFFNLFFDLERIGQGHPSLTLTGPHMICISDANMVANGSAVLKISLSKFLHEVTYLSPVMLNRYVTSYKDFDNDILRTADPFATIFASLMHLIWGPVSVKDG